MSFPDRQQIQIILGIILIAGAIGIVASYVVFAGFHDDLVKEMVKEAKVLLIMGVGAALAIFGLGRTVTGSQTVPPSNIELSKTEKQ